MVNIYEVLQRAVALMQETALNSISPERAGGIMRDTLLALNDLWLQQGSALVISKIYASVAAMEADTAPVSDLTGKPLKPGQIVVIASSDSDNGSVYRYNGTDAPSWSLVGAIGSIPPVDSLDSDSTALPLAAHQGKVLDGKIGQLGQQVIYDVTANNNGATFASLSALLSSENLSMLIPIAVRCGGMSIRFVQSSDNKYAQYRLKSNQWSIAVSNWESIEDVEIPLNNLEDIIYEEENVSVWEEISRQIEWTEGFVRLDGTTSGSPEYRRTQKIPVSSGQKFEFGGDKARFITAYNGETAVPASGVEEAYTYTVPSNIDGVILSFTPPLKPSKLLFWHNTKVIKGNNISRLNNDIETITRKLNLIRSNNIIDPNNINLGHFYRLDGTVGESSSYNCTDNPIPVKEGDVLRIFVYGTPAGFRYITAYDALGNALPTDGGDNVSSYTVPSNVAMVNISWASSFGNNFMITINCDSRDYEPYFKEYYSATGDFLGNNKSANLLNQETLTENEFIRKDGTSGSDSFYAVTDFIPVKQGDVLTAFFGNNTTIEFRFVTSYSENKTVIPNSGDEYVIAYTVPAGVSYVRLSGNKTYLKDATAVITTHALNGKFQPFVESDPYEFATNLFTGINDLYRYPITSLPPYVLGALSYRQLGVLSKGYVCLVSDDGDIDIATYTIPMVISKNVPCTFAAMKSSTCWDNGSAQAIVIDAIQNHGCEIAQHGGSSWLNYDEYTLKLFFDSEKEFWDSLGLTAYGAVCPQHDINDTIRVVAGGMFGCLRTGYIDQYAYYSNGPRSNVFGLSSQSSLDGGLDTQKQALDDAYQNHRLRIIHWHENELSPNDKATLEGLIDYAKTLGLTFITMKEIPYII